MQAGRRFDPLYDPVYKTSDGRAAEFLELENFSDNRQQRLPSFKNMFSALPERYPSYSLRSQSIEAARREAERQSHPTRTSSASPTRSVRSLKLRRAATSPQKPSTSPSLGRTSSSPSKRLLQKGRLERAATDVYPVAIDHAKLKAVFEKALPPLTDAKSLTARKQLLEAWESAEWESREAQIRALQEAQLKEFEESIKAKHAQAEQSISQRLSARWAVEQSSAESAAAKVAHQGMRKSQQLNKMRQREEEKLASARSGGFDGMLGAVGQGMIRARKDVDPQAESEGPPSEAGTMSRTGSSPIRAYRGEDQAAQKGSLRPPSRKELAYAGHLDRVHQAILASKEPEQVADNLSAVAPHDEALPDILVVEDGPDTEQAEQPDELLQQAVSDTALALDEDMNVAAADLAAVVSADAPQYTDVEDVLAAESAPHPLPKDGADLTVEDYYMETGNEILTDDALNKQGIDEHAEEANQADEHAPEHAESAQEPPDTVAVEVAATTDELLDLAISEDKAMTAQEPHAEEEAIGAALEATIEGLVSTMEAAKPGQLSAENQQTDADSTTVPDLGSSEEAGDAEGESVVTITEGVPVLSIIQPQTPHTAASGPREHPANYSQTADGSAAEQQALANSILSGGDAQASPAATYVDNSLLHDEASADSGAATLDSLIGSQYQSMELAAAQGSDNEAQDDPERNTAVDQVTGGDGDSMEQGPTADAAVNVPEPQPAMQEDVHVPVMDSAEALTEEQGELTEAATPSAATLPPSKITEDAASPYAAADTGHVSTLEAKLDEPSFAEATSLNTDTLAPASDIEDAANPYAAADTGHVSTIEATLDEPSFAEAASPIIHTLAPASDTEDDARPEVAADTAHDATAEVPLLEPSEEEKPSEAATLETHDSVQVNLTLVSSGNVNSPTDEAKPTGELS